MEERRICGCTGEEDVQLKFLWKIIKVKHLENGMTHKSNQKNKGVRTGRLSGLLYETTPISISSGRFYLSWGEIKSTTETTTSTRSENLLRDQYSFLCSFNRKTNKSFGMVCCYCSSNTGMLVAKTLK